MSSMSELFEKFRERHPGSTLGLDKENHSHPEDKPAQNGLTDAEHFALNYPHNSQSLIAKQYDEFVERHINSGSEIGQRMAKDSINNPDLALNPAVIKAKTEQVLDTINENVDGMATAANEHLDARIGEQLSRSTKQVLGDFTAKHGESIPAYLKR